MCELRTRQTRRQRTVVVVKVMMGMGVGKGTLRAFLVAQDLAAVATQAGKHLEVGGGGGV